MQSPLKGFGPTLHKFYAPHCTLSNIAVQQAPDWPSPIRYAVMDYLVWASDAFPSELITLLGAARQRGRWPCAQQMAGACG
jgi:hypothetical protein